MKTINTNHIGRSAIEKINKIINMYQWSERPKLVVTKRLISLQYMRFHMTFPIKNMETADIVAKFYLLTENFHKSVHRRKR